jgi:hypothetical protein
MIVTDDSALAGGKNVTLEITIIAKMTVLNFM